MAFSASEAAFEGFRIARREPTTIAVWAVLHLVFGAVIVSAMLPQMRNLMAMMPTPGAPVTESSAQAATLMAGFGGLYLVLLPLELIMLSVVSAAVYRAVLRPEEKGFGRLMLGGDELRLAGLWLLLALLCFVAGIGVVIVLVIIFIGVAAATHATAGGATALLIPVLYLALCIAWFWIAVRLSLAGPMTFAQRRITVFGSWKLTKGHFWPLFGSYLLAFIFTMLIAFLELFVVAVVALAASGGSLTNAATLMMRPDLSSYASYFSPARILVLVLSAPFGALFWAVLISPAAVGYKAFAAPDDPNTPASA